jgi:hypothetical protein
MIFILEYIRHLDLAFFYFGFFGFGAIRVLVMKLLWEMLGCSFGIFIDAAICIFDAIGFFLTFMPIPARKATYGSFFLVIHVFIANVIHL